SVTVANHSLACCSRRPTTFVSIWHNPGWWVIPSAISRQASGRAAGPSGLLLLPSHPPRALLLLMRLLAISSRLLVLSLLTMLSVGCLAANHPPASITL